MPQVHCRDDLKPKLNSGLNPQFLNAPMSSLDIGGRANVVIHLWRAFSGERPPNSLSIAN